MDWFCTNILYNFGSLSGTKLSENVIVFEISVICPPKLIFTVVVQKGWKLMVEKRRRQRKNKTFPFFLRDLWALEAVVMVIKLQTPMKFYIAVVAIWKKQKQNMV